MNITGLEVFILTFLIVTVLVIVIFEKQSIKHDCISETRKSINAAVGPIVHGIIKVVFLIALIVVQFKMDFQNAMVFGIVGGIGLGLMTYFFEPKTKRNRAIIISNNLKTLGIQFILIAIMWDLLWMESEQTATIFSFLTVPICFLAGLIFLQPVGKREFISVVALAVLMLAVAVATGINDNFIPSWVLNPSSTWVMSLVSARSYVALKATHITLSLILAFLPSLLMFIGILTRKSIHKHVDCNTDHLS